MSHSLTPTKIPLSGNSSVVTFPLPLKVAALFLHGSLHGLLGVGVWAEQSLQPAAAWGQWEVLCMPSFWPRHSAQLMLLHYSFSARFPVFCSLYQLFVSLQVVSPAQSPWASEAVCVCTLAVHLQEFPEWTWVFQLRCSAADSAADFDLESCLQSWIKMGSTRPARKIITGPPPVHIGGTKWSNSPGSASSLLLTVWDRELV